MEDQLEEIREALLLKYPELTQYSQNEECLFCNDPDQISHFFDNFQNFSPPPSFGTFVAGEGGSGTGPTPKKNPVTVFNTLHVC